MHTKGGKGELKANSWGVMKLSLIGEKANRDGERISERPIIIMRGGDDVYLKDIGPGSKPEGE